MNTLWQTLLANLALISILVVTCDIVGQWTAPLSKTLQAVLMGVIFGGGAIVSMATAEVVFGFVFDLRAPLIGAAALFGGVPGAIVAGIGALAYRVHLGGIGVMAGLLDISITCAVGIVSYQLTRERRPAIMVSALFSVAVALGRLPGYILVPGDLRLTLLVNTGPAIVAVTFIGSLFIAIVLHWQKHRRELSAENSVLRAMVRELPDCLNVKDLDGRFIVANPATAIFMGAGSAASLIGKSDFDFFPEEMAAQYRAADQEMLEDGAVHRIDQRASFPDGRDGWLSSLKAPLRDENGQLIGIITYNRDITEMRRVAEAKSEFIATVSHELRTPLTSIRGSLGLLAGGVAGQLPEKAANLIKIAYANSERLVRLVNDILDIERIEADRMPLRMQATVLASCLQEAIAASATFQPERGVTIALINDAPDVAALVDPDRLQQVMANLLSNAMKFSHIGGIVEVKLERAKPSSVRISVSDHGTGVPENFRGRIFGKFEQADGSSTREKGGTGLGLSIVKAIVERLGGTIDFHSTVAEGTTFFIDLPEYENAGKAAIDRGLPANAA